MKVNRGTGVDAIGGLSPGGFPNRPGIGGMMPGMPGARKMPGMPRIDNNDNWEAPFTNKPTAVNSKLLTQGCGDVIIGKTSLLLQGSGVGSPGCPSNTTTNIYPIAYSPPTKPITSITPVLLAKKRPSPVAKINPDDFEAFLVGLDMSPHMVEHIVKLLEYLFTRKVLTGSDIGTGCLLYGFQLNEIDIDLPKAPNNFGEIMAKLVLSGCLDFKVVNEVLKKVEDDFIQKDIFDGTIKCISANPSG
ncbi:hypothetical protein IFM89_021871 [Coptis chinensis]|uniref:MI domain-containing protein n=1 Tax=Coptis chinensis TaxID=261450 RepID=A0A835HEP9_9MAGN|nr:hypothetical protein IFM89_021871 [Coptis chinensis]